tara:strand:- start:44 stop:727 length:684 start_codon:yes stop_codon:yes gene_type:complete
MKLKTNLKKIYSKIKSSQKKSGYSHKVEVVGVTKTKPFSLIEESYNCGIKSIGENRIQEAENKFESFEKMKDLKKRFIGHLQSNKVRKCVDLFDAVDSVDSYKTLKKISKIVSEKNKNFSVLIEINTSGEKQKNGFHLSETEMIYRCFYEEKELVRGLMTIGPHTNNKNEIRKSFYKLRKLKKDLCEIDKTINIEHLSMGMSGDYDIAIEEGSTMIRVGSMLYGERN